MGCLVQRSIHKLIKKNFFKFIMSISYQQIQTFIQFFSKLILHKYLLYYKKFSQFNNLTLKNLKTFIYVNS
jgi:hypothetical protein